ncbi:MAG TPA: SpoIIE family protein phosphatase [Bacteroidales bacterium]|nr:SpoIIE family protein phosphatase [Bacteroidales bacterium]
MNLQTKLYILIIFNLLFLLAASLLYFESQFITYFIYISLAAALVNVLGYFSILKSNNDSKNKINALERKIDELEQTHQQQILYIKNQEDEIVKQLESIKEQRNIIEFQKQELEDSITYAFRIQQAILPPRSYIDKILSDYFIFYLPKSIVSGDFYFVEQEGDYSIIAAVDCTGHGVPGAMMSVIGYDLLNQAVKINHITKPSDILSFVDDGVSTFLRQINDESGVHDGMDISIVSINKQFRIVEFAGAYHELYYSHKGEMFEIKGDKLPIGMNIDGVVDQYTNHGIPVDKGDMLYIFSDGFADQFGGNENKKFKYKALKNLLLEICSRNCDEQKEILAHNFIEWQGVNEQVDDVLIIGIRI